MARDIIYDINLFDWRKADNSFYANEEQLYEFTRTYLYPFPNGRKQFFIKNFKTGEFRRFRFVTEFRRCEWYFDENDDRANEILLEFVSEDGILCRVFVNNYDTI